MQKMVFLFLVSLMTACGSLHLKTHYTSIGFVDIARDKAVVDQVGKTRGEPLGREKDLAVFLGSVPAGLEHRTLGRFQVMADTPALPGLFPAYRDGWRKGVCSWQSPLVLLTLWIWAVVPTYYACFAKYTNDKSDILTHVKKLIAAAGGDAAIISFYGEVDSETAFGAIGSIIKLDPRMKGKPLDTTPVPKKPTGGPI